MKELNRSKGLNRQQASIAWLCGIIFSVLTGCATNAEKQYQYIQNKAGEASTEINSCINPVKQTPAFIRLSEVFITDPNDPGMVKKLAANPKITEQNISDILEITMLRKPCQKIAIEKMGEIHPNYVALLAKYYYSADLDAAKLINKEISIKEFNKKFIDDFNSMQSEYIEITNNIISNLNQAHAYEIEKRAEAGRYLQQWMYQQQVLSNQQQALQNQRALINSVNKPVVTNCSYYGATVQCRSY